MHTVRVKNKKTAKKNIVDSIITDDLSRALMECNCKSVEGYNKDTGARIEIYILRDIYSYMKLCKLLDQSPSIIIFPEKEDWFLVSCIYQLHNNGDLKPHSIYISSNYDMMVKYIIDEHNMTNVSVIDISTLKHIKVSDLEKVSKKSRYTIEHDEEKLKDLVRLKKNVMKELDTKVHLIVDEYKHSVEGTYIKLDENIKLVGDFIEITVDEYKQTYTAKGKIKKQEILS